MCECVCACVRVTYEIVLHTASSAYEALLIGVVQVFSALSVEVAMSVTFYIPV